MTEEKFDFMRVSDWGMIFLDTGYISDYRVQSNGYGQPPVEVANEVCIVKIDGKAMPLHFIRTVSAMFS